MKLIVTKSLLKFRANIKSEYNEVIKQRGVSYQARTILKASGFLWDPKFKVWYTPNFYTYYAFKQELDRFNCYYTEDWIEHEVKFEDTFTITSYDGSNDKLRGYQIKEVERMSQVDFAICGFSMRTGKSAIMSKLVRMALILYTVIFFMYNLQRLIKFK